MSFLSGKGTFPLWFLCRMRDMDIIMVRLLKMRIIEGVNQVIRFLNIKSQMN